MPPLSLLTLTYLIESGELSLVDILKQVSEDIKNYKLIIIEVKNGQFG